MNAKTFVKHWKLEKDNFLRLYTDSTENEVEVVSKIKDMNLSSQQLAILNDVLDDVLSDVFYTVLLGLDGSVDIGNGMQEVFKIYDEKGNLISSDGDIESEAYEQFIEV